ncbi:MAG: ABC transporter permease [Clostridiales bacterium]|nr:ABC transporter permease [Clostridiales bacterium]
MKILSKLCMFLVFFFLYAPIAVLILFSFNAGRSTGVFSGFSLYWYKEIFQNRAAMNALLNSLILALSSAGIATILGTAAAAGLHKFRGKYTKAAVMNVTNVPMMNPDIVTGVSMMLLFVFIGRAIGASNSLNFVTLLIAHVTFNLPYVIVSVLPKFKQMDKNLPEAALDLGCTPLRAFFKIEVPQIMPGIFTGFVMAVTLSIDDFVISHFTSSGFQTLPLLIYSMTKKTVTPDMYALSTLIFVTILLLMLLSNLPSFADRHKLAKQGKEKKRTRKALQKKG